MQLPKANLKEEETGKPRRVSLKRGNATKNPKLVPGEIATGIHIYINNDNYL